MASEGVGGVGPLVIQCASSLEFHLICDAWGVEFERDGRRSFARVGDNAIVIQGGLGKVWAAATAEYVIQRWKPALVLDFGTAGSLCESLAVGDVIVVDRVIEGDPPPVGKVKAIPLIVPAGFDVRHASESELASHNALCETVQPKLSHLRFQKGALVALEKNIVTVEERQALREETKALAVSWESAAVGRVCDFHGVAFACVRVISDAGQSASPEELWKEYQKNTREVLPAAAIFLREKLNF